MGSFTSEFSRYEQLPSNLEEEVKAMQSVKVNKSSIGFSYATFEFKSHIHHNPLYL